MLGPKKFERGFQNWLRDFAEKSAGEFLFFPANASGAHKLTNTGGEELIYIDFDTQNAIDACVYPDSKKIDVWGKGINQE